MQNIFIKQFSIIIGMFIFVSPCFSETSGEDLYYRGSYMDAETYFREMDMNHPKDVRWRYNRGCAAYKSDQMEASLSAFNSVTKRTEDPELIFRASYNAGNILFKKGDFASASQFYLQALKIKPDDEDTRHNLALALAKKKAAQQQDNNKQCDNPQQNDQNQDSQNKDGQQNQQDGSQKNDQAQKDKQSQKNQDSEKNKDQSKDSQEQKDSQPSDQNEKKEKPDMSQELKAAQEMPEDQKGEQDPDSENKAQKMAVLKAEALLDNIQENRSLQIKQMASEGKEDARSGKHW